MKKFFLLSMLCSLASACNVGSTVTHVICVHSSGTVYKGKVFQSMLFLTDEVGAEFQVREVTRNEYKCEILKEGQ